MFKMFERFYISTEERGGEVSENKISDQWKIRNAQGVWVSTVEILREKDAKIADLERRVEELNTALNGALRIIKMSQTIIQSKSAGGEGE